MSTPEFFARFPDRIDFDSVRRARVVIVGVGAVGSLVAEELARCGVGELALVDGGILSGENVARHALPPRYVGQNKAEGLAAWLGETYPAHVTYVAENVDATTPDLVLDRTLAGATVIIASTDNRAVQRIVADRALALDVPCVLPGVDSEAARGEVFLALGRGLSPCYRCWDSWREEGAPLRGVAALNIEIFATVEATVVAVLGLLDPESEFAEVFSGTETDPRPRTLFLVSRFGSRPRGVFADGRTDRRAVPEYRVGCPGCGGVPAPTVPEGRIPRPARRAATGAGATRAVATPAAPATTEAVPALRTLLATTALFFVGAVIFPTTVLWALTLVSLIALLVVWVGGARLSQGRPSA
jgi:hypothetical protein